MQKAQPAHPGQVQPYGYPTQAPVYGYFPHPAYYGRHMPGAAVVPAEEVKKCRVAKARYEFTSDSEELLSFQKGDKIVIIEKEKGEGNYFVGYNLRTHKSGSISTRYIEMTAKEVPNPLLQHQQTQMNTYQMHRPGMMPYYGMPQYGYPPGHAEGSQGPPQQYIMSLPAQMQEGIAGMQYAPMPPHMVAYYDQIATAGPQASQEPRLQPGAQGENGQPVNLPNEEQDPKLGRIPASPGPQQLGTQEAAYQQYYQQQQQQQFLYQQQFHQYYQQQQQFYRQQPPPPASVEAPEPGGSLAPGNKLTSLIIAESSTHSPFSSLERAGRSSPSLVLSAVSPRQQTSGSSPGDTTMKAETPMSVAGSVPPILRRVSSETLVGTPVDSLPWPHPAFREVSSAEANSPEVSVASTGAQNHARFEHPEAFNSPDRLSPREPSSSEVTDSQTLSHCKTLSIEDILDPKTSSCYARVKKQIELVQQQELNMGENVQMTNYKPSNSPIVSSSPSSPWDIRDPESMKSNRGNIDYEQDPTSAQRLMPMQQAWNSQSPCGSPLQSPSYQKPQAGSRAPKSKHWC